MKSIVFFLFTFVGSFSFGQIFHFDTQTAVLIKTTNETPAHWYLEIFNDVGVDTTLRWKAHFDNVPAEWHIMFEDQTSYHQGVLDGDSADFALPITGIFPQKLIIGAHTNNTPDDATIYFEIYDPHNPSYKDTIGFVFHISQGTIGFDELQKQEVVELKGDQLYFINDRLGDIRVVDVTGRIVAESKQTMQFDLKSLRPQEMYFLQITQANKSYQVKYLRD